MNSLRIVALVGTLMLTACHQRSWQPFDAAGVPFSRGSRECMYEAGKNSSATGAEMAGQNGAGGMGTSTGLPGSPNSDYYVYCMEMRGY